LERERAEERRNLKTNAKQPIAGVLKPSTSRERRHGRGCKDGRKMGKRVEL